MAPRRLRAMTRSARRQPFAHHPASSLPARRRTGRPRCAPAGSALHGETVHPLVLAGAALIVVGDHINIRAERRRAVPQAELGTVRT